LLVGDVEGGVGISKNARRFGDPVLVNIGWPVPLIGVVAAGGGTSLVGMWS